MEYNLTFNEAMKYLFEHKDKGWVQGENFARDNYLSYPGGIVTINTIDDSFSWAKNTDNVLLTRGLMEQKYRIIKVLNYTNVVGK